MGLGKKLADAASAGLTGAVTGGVGSIISGGLGLLGGLFKKNNNGLKNQQKLMQQAWEYEKEGMGLQYNYGQQAADAEYKRNLQMWKDTNFGAQRAEMEDAGLSVGLIPADCKPDSLYRQRFPATTSGFRLLNYRCTKPESERQRKISVKMQCSKMIFSSVKKFL